LYGVGAVNVRIRDCGGVREPREEDEDEADKVVDVVEVMPVPVEVASDAKDSCSG
jgi:hypothetical protein